MAGIRSTIGRAVRSPATGRVWTALAPAVGRVAGRVLPAVPGRVVVVPPAAPGSLGDDALLAVLRAELGPGSELHVVDLARRRDRAAHGRPADRPAWASDGVADAVRGFPPRGWLALLRARPQSVVVVGADVMNGYYSDWKSARRWDLLACAGSAGRHAVAAGFSWPEPAGVGPQSRRAARGAVAARSSCRDPVSARRFTEATGHPALTGADLAFLLAPDPDGAAVRAVGEWADERRRAGQNPIALNLNGLTLGRADEHPARVAALADAIAALAEDDIAVVLLPHDSRGGAGDRAWARSVHGALAGRAAATVVATPVRGAEAKAMAGALDAVVTGRMHLAIASLGSGVAVSLLDYQGKVEGLDALFPGADIRVALPADEWCRQIAPIARRLVADAPARAAAITRAQAGAIDGARRLVDHARSPQV
jgi:hypothetical protein